MNRKEEYKRLMDEILDSFFKEGARSSSKVEFPIVTKNMLKMLSNLNQQIEEQRGDIKRLEDRIIRSEKEFDILIQELQNAGYIKLSERRKLLKRNILSQDALVNLLKKKRIIGKKELLEELKKLRK